VHGPAVLEQAPDEEGAVLARRARHDRRLGPDLRHAASLRLV